MAGQAAIVTQMPDTTHPAQIQTLLLMHTAASVEMVERAARGIQSMQTAVMVATAGVAAAAPSDLSLLVFEAQDAINSEATASAMNFNFMGCSSLKK